ncbi:hypothetical protein CEXT_394201 [Caerostris extrusa]|uniref:Uncharacterized protein n=1 Tax=Caerostris extrusa TaxID=172846 RepID=A0AAV4QGA1_CAEEX|nr:hypothetical protein CEXT_394201 [Caerostris extrusa]
MDCSQPINGGKKMDDLQCTFTVPISNCPVKVVSLSLSNDAHLGGREEREIIIAPHLFERKEIMADNPEKPGPIQTCRWREETILPALLLQEERRGHQSQTEQKIEQERKIKRQMGGN